MVNHSRLLEILQDCSGRESERLSLYIFMVRSDLQSDYFIIADCESVHVMNIMYWLLLAPYTALESYLDLAWVQRYMPYVV